jgi:hypothetical protein
VVSLGDVVDSDDDVACDAVVVGSSSRITTKTITRTMANKMAAAPPMIPMTSFLLGPSPDGPPGGPGGGANDAAS